MMAAEFALIVFFLGIVAMCGLAALIGETATYVVMFIAAAVATGIHVYRDMRS